MFEKFVQWIKSLFSRSKNVEHTTTEEPTKLFWVIVPGVYEKWVNPSNKNDKHYRAIFRSPSGMRHSKTKFKTATAALGFAEKFNVHLCGLRRENAVRGQGGNGA